jgi:hypothetical protein
MLKLVLTRSIPESTRSGSPAAIGSSGQWSATVTEPDTIITIKKAIAPAPLTIIVLLVRITNKVLCGVSLPEH